MDLDRRLYRAGEVRRLEARHDDDNLTRSRDAGAGFRLRRFDRRLPEQRHFRHRALACEHHGGQSGFPPPPLLTSIRRRKASFRRQESQD
jgi:hypothetical protein